MDAAKLDSPESFQVAVRLPKRSSTGSTPTPRS
jgi:hypothetical protein